MELFFWHDGNCITCGISSLAVMRLRSKPRSHPGELVDKGRLDYLYLCEINCTVTEVINRVGNGLGGSSRLCSLGAVLSAMGLGSVCSSRSPSGKGKSCKVVTTYLRSVISLLSEYACDWLVVVLATTAAAEAQKTASLCCN